MELNEIKTVFEEYCACVIMSQRNFEKKIIFFDECSGNCGINESWKRNLDVIELHYQLQVVHFLNRSWKDTSMRARVHVKFN